MKTDWIPVYHTSFAPAAEIVKGMLAQHDIDAVVMNQTDSAYPAIGQVQLLVAPSDVIQAKHLIAKSEEGE